jgi:hypothetical protein
MVSNYIRRTFYFATQRLDSLREINQDHYHYVLRTSRMLESLADAIYNRCAVPRVPSVDLICQGIEIAANDHRRTNLYGELELAPRPAWSRGNTCGVLSRSSVEPSMMDRMLTSVVADSGHGGPLVHVWPASLHHTLVGPSPPAYLRSTATSSNYEIHLIPILSYCRWILFRIDPQRSTIDLLDFLAPSIGCEMSTFQASKERASLACI